MGRPDSPSAHECSEVGSAHSGLITDYSRSGLDVPRTLRVGKALARLLVGKPSRTSIAMACSVGDQCRRDQMSAPSATWRCSPQSAGQRIRPTKCDRARREVSLPPITNDPVAVIDIACLCALSRQAYKSRISHSNSGSNIFRLRPSGRCDEVDGQRPTHTK